MTILLEVSDLKKHFPVRGGLLRRVVAQDRAVDGVSFTIDAGRRWRPWRDSELKIGFTVVAPRRTVPAREIRSTWAT